MKNIKKRIVVSFEEAYRSVIDSAPRLGTERISISDNYALNRILAKDVIADNDVPFFNKSLRDGFACRRADLDNELKIIETIPAGTPPQITIRQNECARIMTGASVPDGADCVVMVEDTENIEENTIRFVGGSTDDNISLRGEYVRKGDIVLRSGSRIGAAQIAVLATIGCINPLVSLQPRVGIIVTGSELVEPDRRPSAWQIRNSNGFQLAAQAAGTGAIVRNYGIVPDTEEMIDQAFKKAITENDVVISSGGISAGEYDFVRHILEKNNVNILFEKIATNPGRPMVFGVTNKTLCLGMPGTPISAFVLFELLVKPMLFNMMGHDFKPIIARMQLDKTITRKNVERDSWLPVRFIQEGKVINIKYHGSGHINALCEADGLLCIPAGVAEIPEDTIVDIRLI